MQRNEFSGLLGEGPSDLVSWGCARTGVVFNADLNLHGVIWSLIRLIMLGSRGKLAVCRFYPQECGGARLPDLRLLMLSWGGLARFWTKEAFQRVSCMWSMAVEAARRASVSYT